MGLQQEGKHHLRLPPGRPHQLVQLPGHCSGQLRRERGQRRNLYRRGQLHGVCAVLQRELHPQAVRLQTQRLPALQRAVPGRGSQCRPQPVRAERDAVLPLARRGDGLGRQPARQGVRRTGHREADGGRMVCRRQFGRPVLPVPAPPGGQRRAAAGVRHGAGPVARRERRGLRDGQHRPAAVPVGWPGPVGGRPRPGNRRGSRGGTAV